MANLNVSMCNGTSPCRHDFLHFAILVAPPNLGRAPGPNAADSPISPPLLPVFMRCYGLSPWISSALVIKASGLAALSCGQGCM